MTTVAEIESTLPGMTTEHLHQIEVLIHGIYRERHERVIYDDAYGVWLEDDQASAGVEVCALLDEQEGEHWGRTPSGSHLRCGRQSPSLWLHAVRYLPTRIVQFRPGG